MKNRITVPMIAMLLVVFTSSAVLARGVNCKNERAQLLEARDSYRVALSNSSNLNAQHAGLVGERAELQANLADLTVESIAAEESIRINETEAAIAETQTRLDQVLEEISLLASRISDADRAVVNSYNFFQRTAAAYPDSCRSNIVN